jgi:hypothetical protein
MTYDTFPNSRVSNWNKLISSLLVLFSFPPVVFLHSLFRVLPPFMILFAFPCGEEHTGRLCPAQPTVRLWMEPSQHSGPYCSFPTGFDHIITWYRLILSEEEKTSPITHRGILGACSVGTVVHTSGLHLFADAIYLSALVGRRSVSYNNTSFNQCLVSLQTL